MSKKPPICYICEKNCSAELSQLHYCICDSAICNSCINSVKKNNTFWICPKCKTENDVEKSILFRAS